MLLFLLEHAPLKPWQRDVLSIIRDEAYYFAPQGQTKIMNEGWASYWHSTIMTRQGLDAGRGRRLRRPSLAARWPARPARLNPYKLGIELFRDIEDRWNSGPFGKEYDECDDLDAPAEVGQDSRRWAAQKIFEVRRIHNDVTFIDTFLTLDFCREHKLFSFGYNDAERRLRDRKPRVPEDQGAAAVQPDELRPAADRGARRQLQEPRRAVSRAPVQRRRAEDVDYAHDTLANLQRLWSRPVHIETVLEGVKTILSFDGHEHKVQQMK